MHIVEYQPRYGEVCYPEGFEESLRGLTIEEQMKCFRTFSDSGILSRPWRERSRGSWIYELDRDREVSALIVRDGLIVGVMLKTYPWGDVACLVEERVCTYDSDDNNGAGYKSRTDYKGLACISAQAE